MRKKAVIYGATVTAAAIASVLKSNCIVINQGCNCAYEVADSYRALCVKQHEKYSIATKNFCDDLKRRGILKGEYIHPLPVAGLAASYFTACNTQVYLGSTLEKVDCKHNNAEVSFFLNGEKITCTANVFVDTTDYGVYDKYICAALAAKHSNFSFAKNTENTKKTDYIVKGVFDDEYYLKLKVEKDLSFNDAAIMLQNEWLLKYKDTLKDFFIVSAANEFMTVYKEPIFEIDGCCIHIPSASFKNLLYSFEGGLQCAKHIMKTQFA